MPTSPSSNEQEKSTSTSTVSHADLAQMHRLVQHVFDRVPSRELRKVMRLIEAYLPQLPQADDVRDKVGQRDG